MKNIAFIINPIAGTLNKRRIPKQIDKLIDKSQWAVDTVFSEYKGHATELAAQYARLGFDAVVAVGGDGTVNEVASGLTGTPTALGILPIGSGNGFARHLNIPLRLPRAIEMLNRSEAISVDYGIANEQPFFCTCGTGFDAYIADKFAKAGKRGFATYVEHIVKDFFGYQPQRYRLTFKTAEGSNAETIETEAFLITFANANQWGNAAYIAPKASIQDGEMDIAILTKFPLHAVPGLAFRLFEKTLDEAVYMTTLHAAEVTLHRETTGPFHYDGDPMETGEDVNIRIVRDGLRVLAEKRF
ncbi:MAG: YegS/Rv2252/BmrU family lipid kinase [Paludibacteraceae bacterium]|nr:YegS/Rv2252/BmrU family lipid kinase [Paludibacteraceae bacterium]MBQ9705300.1 YegS/Rv2252/BmrU family lipid kinase [Paludibacteraceae bacterium]